MVTSATQADLSMHVRVLVKKNKSRWKEKTRYGRRKRKVKKQAPPGVSLERMAPLVCWAEKIAERKSE